MSAIIDLLVTLLVFGVIGYLIVAKMEKANPGTIDRMKGWFNMEGKKPISKDEEMKRIYYERRIRL